jgi:hypothetical protein
MKFLHQLKYSSLNEFLMSVFPSFKHKYLSILIISVSAISGYVELYLGMKMLTLVAFVMLLTVELVSGIYASVFVKKQKLESARMQRFTIKLTLWLIALFITFSFYKEFEPKSTAAAALFAWMHSGLMIYAALEYLVSVLENIAVISGDTNNKLLVAFKTKIDKYFGEEFPPKTEV